MANGFFYSVKAIVDKASFEQGRAELAKLEQTSKKLIVGIAGAATALTGMATIAGNVAQQEMKVAHSVGMSTTALASWKTACNIAGASANGLIVLLLRETKQEFDAQTIHLIFSAIGCVRHATLPAVPIFLVF